MKFAISLEQREYLRKNGFVPFSDLLNATELASLNQGIDSTIKSLQSQQMRGRDLFTLTRDLWRQSDEVKKIVCSKRLVNLAYDLIEKKPLRLAFDQLLPERSLYSKPIDEAQFFSETASFQDHCCISGSQGLFLICIKTFPKSTFTSAEPSPIEEGGGYFILPTMPFPFDSLTPASNRRFLLIGYCETYSQYLAETQDPQGHFLKSLGYVFGDKLNDRLHPILLR